MTFLIVAQRSRSQLGGPLIGLVALLLVASTSRADDAVLSAFSNPVLQGDVLSAVPPSPSYYDNTSSAYVLIGNSTDGTLVGTPPSQQQGSQLVWGDSPGSSYLLFFGHTAPAITSAPFDLGTIIFGNGTSLLDSLIFGATMSFYIAPAVPNTIAPGMSTPLVSEISIDTTVNNGNLYHDADFITFSGLSNISLNAFEGAAVQAELYGYIAGDPSLVLTNIVLDPGQGGNGFIGNGQLVPEPSTSFLLATGFIGLLCYVWRTQPANVKAGQSYPVKLCAGPGH